MKRFSHLVPLFLVWIMLGACVPSIGFIRGPGKDEQLIANPEFIILTGLSEDIRAVIQEVNTRNSETLDEGSFNEGNSFTIDLGDNPSDVLVEVFERAPNSNVATQGELTIARIRVLPKEGLDDLDPRLLAIEQVRSASTVLYTRTDDPISLPVYAELDLPTALATAPSTSIDPNSVGAHAIGDLTPGAVDFWQQWALGPKGIELLSGTGGVDTHPDCSSKPGSSVRAPKVVVFDTVPSTLTNPIANPVSIPMASGSCVGDLELTVSEVVTEPTPVTTTLQYHGLFASTQIHGVAPGSEVHLVRVLESDGYGYVFDLLQGISGEIDQISPATGPNARWTPTVFNFSLGIHPDANLTPQQWEDAKTAAQQYYEPTGDLNVFRETPLVETDEGMGAPDFLHPATEIAVQLVIWEARQAGVIMVAASGNDADGEQYPAAFVPVLGVGAYGPPPARFTPVAACYSNKGDVYAPAGDVAPSCDPTLVNTCTLPSCRHAVVGVIGWPDNWKTAFWSGTSFAAPLASGLVALRLNNLPAAPGDPATTVDELVSGLQDTSICTDQIDSHCRLILTQVLNAP